MVDELEVLSQTLNRLIEQDRFSEAQALLPEYTQEIDRRLRENDGPEALKRAITVFQIALMKVRSARAHMAAQLSDTNRARAYTGKCAHDSSGWQLMG